MNLVLCIALYLTPYAQVPLADVCQSVPEPDVYAAIGECNRNARCEWISRRDGGTELDWTLTDPYGDLDDD